MFSPPPRKKIFDVEPVSIVGFKYDGNFLNMVSQIFMQTGIWALKFDEWV